MKSFSTIAAFTVGICLVLHSAARAGWEDGWWYLDFNSGTSSTAAPLRVGVDQGDGGGFTFQTLVDVNGDGVIHLRRVPVGGRLAIGAVDADGEVLKGCDIWDLAGSTISGSTIQKPLLVIAEDVEGESLGADYGDFTQPPFALTPGAPYTVTNGSVVGWPEPRFVNDFGVPGLEEFVVEVDSLPNFSGNVLVSTATLTGTFVPEPSAAILALTAAASLITLVRSRGVFSRAGALLQTASRIFIVMVASSAACSVPRAARAESFTWVFPGDGNWDTPTNWTPYLPLPPNPIVGPPDALDVAIIQTPYRVTLQDDYLALSGLLIANGASVNMNFNSLSVVADDHGGVATITGQGSKLIVRHTAGNVNAFFADQVNLSNGGELDIEGTVARIIAGLGVDADSLITGRGELYVSSSIAGLDFNNRGTIRPDINQTIAITAPVGTPSIDLDGSGANLNSHLDLSNAGATLIVEPTLTDAYSGLITLGDSSTLTINHSWSLAGTFDLPSRIDFDPGAGNTAHVSGSLLSIGGESFHGNLQAQSGVGNVDAPIELHSNANVSVSEDANISFNGPTTIHGGTLNTFSTSLADGDIDFNGPTTYSGNMTINGIARQQGNATVNGASIISGDAFDMDGASGNTLWDINTGLEVHATQIDTGNNTFNGTFDIGGPTVARLAIHLTDPQASWVMAGTMNLGGIPIGFANRVAGSKMVVTGQLNVQQRVDISADTTLSAASTTDIDSSTDVLQMRGTTVVEPGATITGDGYLQNAVSGDMSLPAGLSTGNVSLSNEGVLRLGDAVGVVAVAEFVQSAGATLVADVGRNTTSTDSDVLTISSSMAFVDGFIQPNIVNIGGAFQPPQIGDTFTILTAVGGVSGTFDDVLDANLGGQVYEWSLIHNPNNVQIQLADIGGLLGDYNQNGVVDAPDYVLYRSTIGSLINLAADGNQNGIIDPGDYDIWRMNFGMTAGSGSAHGAAVPGPSSLLLAISAVIGIALPISRRRRALFPMLNRRRLPQ